MNNDTFEPITELLLASLPYNSELIFRDGKTYRKEYSAEDIEWRELGEGWTRHNYKASAKLAAEYSEAQIWPHDHKNTKHKFITGDRLDSILGEADKLAGQATVLFGQARTADQLFEARLREERANGIYEALRIVRGYHEGN